MPAPSSTPPPLVDAPELVTAAVEPGYELTPFDLADDVDPIDVPSSEDDDVVDLAQQALDAAPSVRKKPGPKPKYKPGTRREPAATESSTSELSWWARPGADFAAEAQRMRDSPKRVKVPGENSIIGMGGVW